MSAKKSWDVQPRRTSRPVEISKTPVRKTVAARPARRQQLPKGSLQQRRKQKRRYARYVSLFLLIAVVAGSLYALWLPGLRVSAVTAHGPNAETVEQIAHSKLRGTYAYIVPHNSIFFLPSKRIRAAVQDAHPDISAVSFARTSFSSIEVTATPRASSFVWCGTSIDIPHPLGCFDADIEGLLFKAAGTASSTGSQVRVFSELDQAIAEGQSPLRTHVAYASAIPGALRFVKAMKELGIPVSSLALRGDEADLWISGTRITYVIGQEQEAAQLAASALPNLSLTDGSIEYVDLRFKGKVYIKKYGE